MKNCTLRTFPSPVSLRLEAEMSGICGGNGSAADVQTVMSTDVTEALRSTVAQPELSQPEADLLSDLMSEINKTLRANVLSMSYKGKSVSLERVDCQDKIRQLVVALLMEATWEARWEKESNLCINFPKDLSQSSN